MKKNIATQKPDDQPAEKKPFRVFFVLTSLPVGGAEMLLLDLIKGFDRQKIEASVVCLKDPGELGPTFAELVPVHSQLIRSKYDVGVLVRLWRLFRKSQADAVITVGAGDKMFWGRIAAKLAGVPVICSALHSTGWPDGVGRLNRLLTPITDGFIAVAQNHAVHLTKYERFPEDKVFTIPNGVDVERFMSDPSQRNGLRQSLGVSLDSHLVGIVAALRNEKNHVQFVQAGRQVLDRFPNTHFVIVGDGPERQTIETAIKQTGFESHFHLLGSRKDTEKILASLDVFCLTSHNEANPVSILEALSCGIPVVSPDVGSISETVQSDRTGILTKPGSADETAQAICRMLENPTWSASLGSCGRQLVASNWSRQSMVSGYQDLVETLYNRKLSGGFVYQWDFEPVEVPAESKGGTGFKPVETRVSR